MRFVDIHSHIIPGVDDGAESLEESLEMLRIAEQHGVTDIIATPHNLAFEYGMGKVTNRYKLLVGEAKRAGIDINLYLGSEIYCYYRGINKVIKALNADEIPSLNRTRYVLVEFDPWDVTLDEVADCLSLLITNGWIPIIAHAERYRFVDDAAIDRFKSMECKIQVNIYSFEEERDSGIRSLARKLLEEKKIDFLGSDMHGIKHRAPRYEKGMEYIKEVCGEDYTKGISSLKAQKLLIL